MTILGSHRRTREAGSWWRAQRRDWPVEQRRQYEARLRASPLRAAPAAPLDRQEPTEVVTMRARDATTGKQVEVGVAVRRISDARFWDGLDPDEEWAAQRIAEGFQQIDRGLGVRNVSVENGTGQGGPRVGHPPCTRLVVDYFAWATQCVRDRIDHSAIMDVLGYGKSCRATDEARRRRKGYTRQQIAEGLWLYLALHGRVTRRIA